MRDNTIYPYSIEDWENAIEDRTDIDFTEFHLHKKGIDHVCGYIIRRGLRLKVYWTAAGKCFLKGKHEEDFDIKFWY